MRRIRHLEQCDYVIPITKGGRQALALSGNSNVILQRTWDQDHEYEFGLELHAKFNSGTMNGLQIVATLKQGPFDAMSSISEFLVYRVADGSFTETLVATVSATMSGYRATANVTQSALGLNELSGAETYSITAVAQRHRRFYRAKVWVNHLGCFDSINRLRQKAEWLEIGKVDG